MNSQLNLPTICQISDANALLERLGAMIGNDVTRDYMRLSGKRILFFNGDTEVFPLSPWEARGEPLHIETFEPIEETALVTAVDSSCIPLGETDEGSVYAAKIGVAFSTHGTLISYLKLGPSLIYIDEQSAQHLLRGVGQASYLARIILTDKTVAQRMIRVKMERMAQFELARAFGQSIILIDGSLRSSIFDSRAYGLRSTLEEAEKNGNAVLGVAKSTSLRLIARLSSQVMAFNIAPSFADIHELVKPFLLKLEGRVLMARFSKDGLAFRVDVSSWSALNTGRTLGILRANEAFFRGYPETLRLAHHLSLFTRAEDASIKSYLTGRLGVVRLEGDVLRKTVLGNLGGRTGKR